MKHLLALLLVPLARLAAGPGVGLGRIWAFSRLRAALRHPVPNSVVVLGTPEIHGSGNIRLGAGLFLYRDLYLETQGAGEIVIGDEVVCSRGVHIVSFARVVIGEGSMVGEYTSIRDANHQLGTGGALRHSGHTAEPITLGRQVWLGRGVTVLGGVTIGDGAVVGANAVVTRDVVPGAIVAGVPAKPLGARRSAR